ncbi:MAG TPA: ATP-binding protein, partial [Nocardioidaceae bacterium]|nr:ATP-binding protein [Nocardioidaceae bacterium]
LTDEGLAAALRSVVAGSVLTTTLETYGLTRPPARVEAALYFCGMEAVQNATKHSGAGAVVVRVYEDSHGWRLTITDDGTGFDQVEAAAAAGTGLANMRDRLDAVGGTVEVASMRSTGTTVTAVVPRHDETETAHETLSSNGQVA